MSKNYSSTYLYGKFPEYDTTIYKFIMEATPIDKDSSEFEDILFEVKRRQITPALSKVLKSDIVVLLVGNKPLPRQFKTFCAKDIKGRSKNDLKVYVDCTDLIKANKAGVMVCENVDIFVSYLVSAMTNYIYYADEKRFTNNHNIISIGAKMYSELFTHVVDIVTKISSTDKYKSYCKYLCALYYISSILGKDFSTPGNMKIARDISGLSERAADIVDMELKPGSFINIKFFSETLSNVLRMPKLTVDVIVEEWMYLYGVNTVFGLELFPAFTTMITDCYVGAYLNNQKSIEKITGQSMVAFTKAILTVGDDTV